MSFQIFFVKSEFRERNVSPKLMDYANENRDEGIFNDVVIETNDEDIPANRLILSCCSPFFEKLFKTDMKEKSEKSVTIDGVCGRSLKLLIDFMYSGKIQIDNENVVDILATADYLQLNDVREFCMEFLQSVIDNKTCFTIFALANLYHSDELLQDTQQFINNNFEHVRDYCTVLPKDDMICCISNLDRKKILETSVFEVIVAWVKFDEENRKTGFFELLELVKLNHLPVEFLEDVVPRESLVNQSLDCSNLVMNHCSELLKLRRVKENQKTKIISVGGTKTPFKVVEVYDQFDEPETQYPDLPKQHISCEKISGSMYAICDKRELWRLKLDETTLKWKLVANLETKIHCEKLDSTSAYSNTLAGACCHYNSTVTLFYVPELTYWVDGPRFNGARKECQLVCCGDILYALGGISLENSATVLSSVEKLQSTEAQKLKQNYFLDKNQLRDKWVNGQPMQKARHRFAAVNCNGFIYAIGGQSGQNLMKNVEKYDPETDEWSYAADMIFERRNHAACVLGGKIFVVGGLDKDGIAIKEVECYEPLCDSWTLVGNTVDELYGHSLIAM